MSMSTRYPPPVPRRPTPKPYQPVRGRTGHGPCATPARDLAGPRVDDRVGLSTADTVDGRPDAA